MRRQLNKGESLHALRRDLFFAYHGHVRQRHLDDQIDQALCLTLVTNSAVLWTTIYLGDALDALRTEGLDVSDDSAAHLTPAQHDHINFYGTYSCDIDAELRRERTPAATCHRLIVRQVHKTTRFAPLLNRPLNHDGVGGT